MDLLIRYGLYGVAGVLLLIANALYIRSLTGAIRGSGLVVAPFEVVSEDKPEDAKFGTALARMLCSRLQDLYAELSASESIVRTQAPGLSGGESPAGKGPVYLPTGILHAPAVQLPTLFKSMDIKASVAGVEVGGLLSWLHDLSAERNSVKFSVVIHKDGRAQVSGDVSVFSKQMGGTLWLSTKADPETLVTDIAATLLQRKLAEDLENHVELLTLPQFESLLEGISRLAAVNRQTAGGVASTQEMKGVFEVVVQISDRAPGWHSLRLLTAELARRVGERDRAAGLFEEIVAAQQKSPDDRQLSELVAKADVVKTLEGLRKELSASAAPADLVKRIAGDIEYALEFYRRFFGISVATPPVRIDNSFVNTYFDGSSYVAHPVAAETPDVTYHEMFHAILGPLGLKPKFQGQPGALIESLADVFASVVKQKRLSQTAQTADWVLGKGFLASLAPGMENAPIRSLKAPGTAYKDNPRLGSDPQPDNMSGYKRISDDNGGIHIYCGIPNKAFYNAAMALGTEDAAQIWRMAIEGLKADANFDDFAARTAASAGKLLGAEKAAQVKSAWQKVGLLVDKTARRVPDAPEDAVHGGLRREARRQ